MENQVNGNQFRDEEIVIMSHWDKNKEEWVRTVYPKIGGRLRLAHEDNNLFEDDLRPLLYLHQRV